ncbi:MAG: amidohydrolase family protein [Chloroflexi bacterium]|nr:amidohydrolase family protein [Chloroflexota bacterium]
MTTARFSPRGRVPAAPSAALILLALVMGCTASSTNAPASPGGSAAPSGAASPTTAGGGSLLIVGRIVTMDEPAVAEALLIEDGAVVAVGSRDEVLALAGEQVPVIDIGQNVAYPGFIDAHAHWIGDREYYSIDSPAEAMDAAIARGWTSISEQWVDHGRLSELETLAAADALPLRVDAYLALNALEVGGYYGDWYADREPGPVDDRLRVQGLKIHLDSGTGAILYWEPADLTATIGRAVDAGWQVSVHAVSTEAQEMVLDAFEAAIGPRGPNPLHHRIEHALQVTDVQLARMVAMDLVPVIQLDGAPYDWVLWAASAEGDRGRDLAAEDLSWLARWSDFLEAGLHVAATSDAPWFFPDGVMTDDLARPMDQIAGGMDGRGRDFPETPGWMVDQLLTAQQGLRAVTVDAAYALGDEMRRGRLASGTLGDVTILSGDVTSATPDEIRAFEVIATIVNGDVAYCSDTAVCGD